MRYCISYTRKRGLIMYNFAANIVKIILRIFGKIHIHDKANLPQSGGYVIACTHTGWVDILWLGVSVMPVQIHYMAKKELFKSRFLKWLMNGLNAFPVVRENPDPSYLKVPQRLIKENQVVCIFPSGTRTSEEVPLKRGAVTIASRSKAPIVPAAYAGPTNFKELLKRKKPHIIFGEPIHALADLSRRVAMEHMAVELDDALKSLQAKIK